VDRVFKTGAFNHSATIPGNQIKWLVRALLATKRKLQPDRNRHAHFSTPQLRRRVLIQGFVSGSISTV
jgi:hypothetical protein